MKCYRCFETMAEIAIAIASRGIVETVKLCHHLEMNATKLMMMMNVIPASWAILVIDWKPPVEGIMCPDSVVLQRAVQYAIDQSESRTGE